MQNQRSISSLRRKNKHSFCGICWRQCHYEFHTVFWRTCIIFCAKPKEVNPMKLISLQQINLSIALKYRINNSVWKHSESGHWWLQHFLFSLKISITAIWFYWHNDTPTFCHLAEIIPQISSFLRLLVICLVPPDLFIMHYCLFIFSKNLFLSSASLANATPALSKLWFNILLIWTLQKTRLQGR